jgi:electron transfer flavoprotein alpha subunit
MATLVFLEHHGNELQKGSLGVLAKAASLGDGDVAAVIAGEGVKALAAEAGKFGAAKVWVCEDAEVAQPLPQPRVDVLAQVVEEGGYDGYIQRERTWLKAASVLLYLRRNPQARSERWRPEPPRRHR